LYLQVNTMGIWLVGDAGATWSFLDLPRSWQLELLEMK